jgi:hypothetical protein
MHKLMNPTLKIPMLRNRPLQNLCFLKVVHIKSEWDLSQNVDKWRMVKTKHPSMTSGAYFQFPKLRASPREPRKMSLKTCFRCHPEKYEAQFFFPPTITLKVDLPVLLIGPHQHLGPQYCLFY